jgi:hypothetical protein
MSWLKFLRIGQGKKQSEPRVVETEFGVFLCRKPKQGDSYWLGYSPHPFKKDEEITLTVPDKDGAPDSGQLARISITLSQLPQLIQAARQGSHGDEIVSGDSLDDIKFINEQDGDLAVTFSTGEDDTWVTVTYLNSECQGSFTMD